MTVRTSHADLLRAFRGVSSPAHEYVASLCGFEVPADGAEAAEQAEKQAEPEAQERRTARRPVPPTPGRRTGVVGTLRILPPVHMTFRDSLEKADKHWLATASPISPDDWRVPQNPPPLPRKPDLMPWPRLWPFLHRTHSRLASGPKLAIGSIVAAIARLAPMRRLPYEPVWRWTRDSWMLLDKRDALFPFHDDQEALRKRWFLLFGKEACRTLVCPDGKPPAELPPAGTPVLYIGDFGMLQNRGGHSPAAWDRETARSWIEYGLALRHRGCSACALVPCPRQRWDPTIAKVWTCAYWSESATAPPVERGWTPLERTPETDARALREMTVRAAPALRIERSLLRELRRLLPHQWNHPGVEYDFFHDASRHLDAVFVSRDKVGAALAGFRSLPPDTKQRIVDLLRTHHVDCAEIVRARETLLLEEGEAPVTEEEWKPAVRLVHRACAALLQYVRTNDAESIRRLGFTNWQEAELESFTRLTAEEIAVAWKLVQKARGEAVAERPEVIARQDLLWLEALLNRPPDLPISWEMHRAGPDLRWEVAPLEPAERSASPRPRHFVRIPARGGGLEVIRTSPDGMVKEDRVLEPNCPVPVADIDRKIQVRTDQAILNCEAWKPPRWASRFGWDRCGMLVDFVVGGVMFTLRWIPPGEFTMGSPEDEPGRADWEGPQHRVTIERGFWLGETPVTQAQYAAVTGEHPSYFPHAGDHAPVEQVSWEDGQAFCEKLADLVPDFDTRLTFRLPSEAEWEYACRAGTNAALYTGPLTILGESNGPELDAIVWYGGNSGVDYEGSVDSSDWKEKQYDHQRAGTHPVRQKVPNPWGLYDMLGNVWEWCEDGWHDSYEGAPADGAAWIADGSRRVNRGGSWADLARYYRCAYRLGWDRGARSLNLGFRLVLASRFKEDAGPFS